MTSTSYDGVCGAPAARGTVDADTENISTTNLTVADKWGNVVEYTLTIEQTGGSGMAVPRYGFLLNNELTDFSTVYDPADPNRIQPGKRPRSSMSPTIVLKDGKPFMALGSPGGSTIITTVLQMLVNRIDLRMGVAAVDPVEQHLQHRGDDRRAAGRAERQERLAVLQHDRRATSRTAAACRAGSGWGRPRRTTVEKSVSSLLSRKPRPGTMMPEPPVCSMVSVYSTTLPHLSATVRLVVEMFSVSGVVGSRAAGAAHTPSYDVGVAGRDRLDGAPGPGRSAGALGGEPVGEQVAQRHVDVRRVADVLAAVGEGQRARLEVVVQRLGVAHRRRGR